MTPPRPATTFGLCVAAACLLSVLLAACDPPAPTPSAPPASPAVQTDSPSLTPTPSPAPKTWTDIPASAPENRVTVHYHRQDDRYDDAGIWTWDSYQKNTPKDNELSPVGKDDFGAVFQFDRANYGLSDKIGLIPRLGHDWKGKDGGDKFWTPALGNEVWLISNKPEVFTRQPDLSPHIEAAYLDDPGAILVRLTHPVRSSAQVTLLDQQNVPQAIESVFSTNSDDPAHAETAIAATRLVVTPRSPLDVAGNQYRVQVQGFGAPVPLTPRRLLDDRDLFFDADAQLGAACNAQGTAFRLFAPTATSVSVVLYDEATGNRGQTVRGLQRQPKGLWLLTVAGDLRGKFYAYRLTGPDLDPAHEVLDPYATNAVASSARARLTEPTAAPRPGPAVASPTDMVVYEMHVRDFTVAATSGAKNRGLYPGFVEGDTRLPGNPALKTALDHLSELGVTHVQLLPVQDYENHEAHPSYNWGYVTTAFFSPEGAYATDPNDDSRVREFKALVDALHARGIGVILDVVYNHTSGSAPFQSIVPGYFYRHLPDGSLANGSGCGNEFRTEAPMVRRYILDSLKYWTREYGIDGYRFDLMALLDQETMRQAERELRAINPNIALYGEPWTADATPLRDKTDKGSLFQVPVGAFNDDFRNALKGSPDGRDPGFIQNGSNRDALKSALLVSSWFASPAQSINYMTCHDNLVLWDKLKSSMPGAADPLLEDTMKLGYLALFTAQGVPFLHGGEEFARTKGGNHNSYDAPDSVNQVDWSLKEKHFALFTYVRDLISLRKAHPAFRLRTRQEVADRLKFQPAPTDKTLLYTLDASGVPGETWRQVCVVMNSDNQADAEITLPSGRWLVALDERGASPGERAVSGKAIVRRKSGLILYQK